MALWANMVTIAMPRNGTASQTVDPATSGTVVAGARFAATAGRKLVCVAIGAVTFTTPNGWTLPSGGSAVNNGGLYRWDKVATGGDTITTTNNGANYPSVYTFYEFSADSTILASAANSNQPKSAGAGPTLALAAGTKLIVAVGAQAYGVASGTPAWSAWGSAAIEHIDVFTLASGTDGYSYGSAYIEDSTATSLNVAATLTSTETNTVERLLFAVQVPTTSSTTYAGAATLASGSALVAATTATRPTTAAAMASGSAVGAAVSRVQPVTAALTSSSGLTAAATPVRAAAATLASGSALTATATTTRPAAALMASSSALTGDARDVNFVGDLRYDWNDGTVQGWTMGLGSSAANVGNQLRITAMMMLTGAGHMCTRDDNGTLRGGALAGDDTFAAVLTLQPGSPSGPWDVQLQYRTADFMTWVSPTQIMYRRVADRTWVTGLAEGVPTQVIARFAAGIPTNISGVRTYISNSTVSPAGVLVVDQDNFRQGNFIEALTVSAALTSSSSLTGATGGAAAATAVLTSASALTATPSAQAGAAASLASGSSVLATSTALRSTAALLASGSNLSGAPAANAATAALTSSSSLAAAASAAATAAAVLTSGSTLTGSTSGQQPGSVVATSSSSLTSTAALVARSAAVLTSSSALSAALGTPGAATLTSGSSLAAAASAARQVAVNLTSGSALSSDPRTQQAAVAALASASALTALVGAQQQTAAALASGSSLASTGGRLVQAAAALLTASRLQADASVLDDNELHDHDFAGALAPRRWTGRLLDRAWSGHLEPRRWQGAL